MQDQKKMVCGDYIELQHYNQLGGKKSKNSSKVGRLVMGNSCEICYSFHNVLSDSEIKRSRNIGGKNPLLICGDCFNSNIKYLPWEDPVTRGKIRASMCKKNQQES